MIVLTRQGQGGKRDKGRSLLITLLAGLILLATAPVIGANNPSSVHRTLVELAPTLRQYGFRLGAPLLVRVFKLESQLEVWLAKNGRFELFRIYPICMYSGGLGPKLREGDRQSPEGIYRVSRSALRPNSSYHLAFDLGYPNLYDRTHGRSGSRLMVHGKCASRGCYAMTDSMMEEIYGLASAALANGQDAFQVQAYPFRMNGRRLQRYEGTKWYDFWRNLKEGYDHFEQSHMPLSFSIHNRRYAFETDLAKDHTSVRSKFAQW